MKSATVKRPPPSDDTRLSDALAAATAMTKLHGFAHDTGCDPLELSADGGKSLDLLRVLAAMRKRGYTVAEPVKPQAQTVPGHTVWLINITIAGARATLGVAIPKVAP